MSANVNVPALVILAAGGGRRYQGLKQLAPVGPHGESIMEYSIHDALAAGFGRIVLVVRRAHEPDFRERFVEPINSCVDVELTYQELEVALQPKASLPVRERPWGTAHAVLCARHHVHGPFAVINADDFYGRSALASMGACLREGTAREFKPGCVNES